MECGYESHMMVINQSDRSSFAPANTRYKLLSTQKIRFVENFSRTSLTFHWNTSKVQVPESTNFSLDNYKDLGHFQQFNNFWKWTPTSFEYVKNNLLDQGKLCIMKPKYVCDLKKTGDSGRVPSTNIFTQQTHCVPSQEIQNDYLQVAYKTPDLCVWLSMTILVSLFTKELSNKMIDVMKKNIKVFQNLKPTGILLKYKAMVSSLG